MSDKVTKLADKINNLSPEGRAAAVAAIDVMNAKDNTTDIFLWANNIDAVKKELQAEVFLFNKNYTPYHTSFHVDLKHDIDALFLYNLINDVNLGAGTGLTVRDIEFGSTDANVLQHVDLGKVGRAETILHYIENERQDIVEFSNDEHDFKRMKGIVVRYTHPTDKSIKFHVFKLIQQTTVLTGGDIWDFNKDGFIKPQTDVRLRMAKDNQVLIIGGDIFAFNADKFEKLFNYDIRKTSQAEKNGEAIDKHFKLSMPTIGQGIAFMALEKGTLTKKLIDVDVSNLIDQETVLDIADEMAIQLMADDDGAIILMDSEDVGSFLDIINDNYVRSLTGRNYLAKSKKAIDEDGV